MTAPAPFGRCCFPEASRIARRVCNAGSGFVVGTSNTIQISPYEFEIHSSGGLQPPTIATMKTILLPLRVTKLLVPVLLLSFALRLHAQVSERWATHYDGGFTDYPTAVALDSAGNAAVVGYSFNGSTLDFRAVKYAAADGSLLWPVTGGHFEGSPVLSPESTDQPYGIAVDSAGNVIVTGRTSDVTGNQNCATVKFAASDGQELWRVLFDGPIAGEDYAYAVAVDAADNVIIAGSSESAGGGRDVYAAKYAADGAHPPLWERRYDTTTPSGTVNEEGFALALDAAGNAIITGYTGGATPSGGTEYLVLKLAAGDGHTVWAKTFPAIGLSQSVAVGPNGDVAITGKSQNFGAGNHTLRTIKLAAADGTLLWDVYNTTSYLSFGYSVAMDPFGNVAVAGVSYNSNAEPRFYAAKYASPDGALMWEKEKPAQPGLNRDGAYTVAMDALGNAYVLGHNFNGSNHDLYTVKYASAGGTILWEKSYVGGGEDEIPNDSGPPGVTQLFPPKLALTADGTGIIITGASTPAGGNADYVTIRYEQPPNTASSFTLQKPSPAASEKFGTSMAASGSRVVVGAALENTGAPLAGSVYVYDLSSATPTVALFTLHNPDPGVTYHYGTSVAIEGTRVVVGAIGSDVDAPNAGRAYIYDLSSATPTVPILTLHNPNPGSVDNDAFGDRFGGSVGISGTRVVVGASREDIGGTNAGRAYVYELTSGLPTLVATLDHPGGSLPSGFGQSVAISGPCLVVGAHTATPAPGGGFDVEWVAYAYDFTSGTPTGPEVTLRNPVPGTGFLDAEAIDGTRVVVGDDQDNTGAVNAGRAFVFDLTSSTPTVPVQMLNNPDPGRGEWLSSGSYFGYSVAISGTRVLVGGIGDDTGAEDAGIAHLFDLSSATPSTPVKTFYNLQPAPSDQFGSCVAITDSWAVVGAFADDLTATDAGTAYVYYLPKSTDQDGDLIDDAWENMFFGGAADPAADSDGDGSNNLLEFARGTDPTNPGSSPVSAVGLSSNRRHFTWTFCVPAIPPASVRYTVEASTDLGVTDPWAPIATHAPGAPWTDWTPSGIVSPPVPGPNGTVCLTVFDPNPLTLPRRFFLRLRVGP